MQERGRETQQHGEVKKFGGSWPSIFRSNGVWFSIQSSFLFYALLNSIIHLFSKYLLVTYDEAGSSLWSGSSGKAKIPS